MTLKGVRRVLGDTQVQERPVVVSELLSIFHSLDMSVSEDLAYWVAILLGFRGLLRKSNLVEEDMAVRVRDVHFHDWGLSIPFTVIR